MSTFFRPTWIEINLSIIKNNYINLRRYLKSGTKIISVVKANAYGMGLCQTVKALQEVGCKNFAVATPDEALELRQNGCHDSILVIGPSTSKAFPMYIKNDIETICTTDMSFETLVKEATIQQKQALIHFKIDTGMGRSGFSPETFYKNIKKYSSNSNIRICGILSHFAVADEGPNQFTENQFERFIKLLDKIQKLGIDIGIKHICNSAATITYPHMHLDAVRVGKLLHGFWPNTKRPFESKYPFKVRSEIVSLRKCKVGEPFGYGLRYTARNNDLIAVVPIGYADGYSRMYLGKTSALIKGHRAPVVASICCDQIFIKVTDIPGVSVGDEVILLGEQGDQIISPEELGACIGTSACEAFSLFRGRIPRVYLK